MPHSLMGRAGEGGTKVYEHPVLLPNVRTTFALKVDGRIDRILRYLWK